jgi:hypothetical protein
VLVLFAILALVVNWRSPNPEIRRINLTASQYAEAWRTGDLATLEYDALSGPGVEGDPGKVADNVTWIVGGLDGDLTEDKAPLRPEKIELDPAQTVRSGKGNDLATAKLWVTWKLMPEGLDQSAHYWTYPVTVQERLFGGRWRVVWKPETVHPSIRQGLVLRLDRTLVTRNVILGAGDTQLVPTNGQPQLAKAVLGSISEQLDPRTQQKQQRATVAQSQLDHLRARPNDPVGVTGLQELFDARLGGGARIEVKTHLVNPPYRGIGTPEQTLFRGAPETPRPVKITLDRRTQVWAEQALAGVSGPATLVVVKPSTGDLLAVADTPPENPQNPPVDYGLLGQAPPGASFQLASALALLRSPARSQQTEQTYQLTTRIDCSDPYTVGGQVIRNYQGPRLAGVQLGAAVEGGCVTGLARTAGDVSPETLQTAAYDLGFSTPKDHTDDTPGYFAIADLLGVPAFHGSVPPTPDTPDRDRLAHAQNMIGEGDVLMSPLSMARAAATVASGTRRAVRFVVDPIPRNQDTAKKLDSGELQALQTIMAKGVTEDGGSAKALRPLGDVHALAGTGGYGSTDFGRGQQRSAWCYGYLGDYAFAVLAPAASGGVALPDAAPAVTIASKFLTATRTF